MCLSFCFGLFIVLSLIFHLGELTLNTVFLAEIYQSRSLTWFTIVTGLLVLPLVTIHFVSALLILQKKNEDKTKSGKTVPVLLHIFLLGFAWRHLKILLESDIKTKKRDFADLSLLRLFYTFSASLPILTIQGFMIITSNNSWIVHCALAINLISISWGLASFRRQYDSSDFENVVLTWPGTVFRLLWRLGEITSRVISLGIFASIYFSWIFLVICLHWITMMCCVCSSVLGNVNVVGMNKGHKFIMSGLVSYIYIFCHVNMSVEKTKFHYITFYTIMFLENSLLTVIWFFTTQDTNNFKMQIVVVINGFACIISIISMLVYYRFFHIPSMKISLYGKDKVCVQDGCINCKLSLCAKHSHLLQRPFSAGWVSQYQKALHDGNYYKNLLQDSYIDSMSEWETCSSTTASSKLSKKSNSTGKKTRKVPIQLSGTYSHRHFVDADIVDNVCCESDTDASTTETHHMTSSEDSIISELSIQFPPQGIQASDKKKLLTESWDNLKGIDNPVFDKNSVHPLFAFRPISAQSLEEWYSDGYSTDHTSDYQLPVTVLAKNSRHSMSLASSDCTDCTVCKYMKVFHSRRKYPKAPSSIVSRHERITEESEDMMHVEFDKLDTPRSRAWYNCSESGDSAFPQENFSSSNLDMTLSEEEEEGVFETGAEIII
ncbi:uncharacterized protein LOC133177096 [Saccostrea echinata]|uniref:uncharacterized protein LOC133177096 n=1 Tax=Saccostrea echinata TaxID=191078 RepID=UPI002A7EFE6F|nr:uncharacterized protein LOC133177096 [Saccostrea echinata]